MNGDAVADSVTLRATGDRAKPRHNATQAKIAWDRTIAFFSRRPRA